MIQYHLRGHALFWIIGPEKCFNAMAQTDRYANGIDFAEKLMTTGMIDRFFCQSANY